MESYARIRLTAAYKTLGPQDSTYLAFGDYRSSFRRLSKNARRGQSRGGRNARRLCYLPMR